MVLIIILNVYMNINHCKYVMKVYKKNETSVLEIGPYKDKL